MKRLLTIIVGFLHDLAAGCWAATVLSIYWIERILKRDGAMKGLLQGLQKEFFYIGLVCVAVVLIAGVGRTFTYAYVGEVYGRDAEAVRRRSLVIKHIVLFVLFGAGIYWQYRMAFD